jgi:hypothetical protein
MKNFDCIKSVIAVTLCAALVTTSMPANSSGLGVREAYLVQGNYLALHASRFTNNAFCVEALSPRAIVSPHFLIRPFMLVRRPLTEDLTAGRPAARPEGNLRVPIFAVSILAALMALAGCGGAPVYEYPITYGGEVTAATNPASSSAVFPWQNPVYSSASDQEVGPGNAWENQLVNFSPVDVSSYKFLVLHIQSATPGLNIAINLGGKDIVVRSLTAGPEDVIVPLSMYPDLTTLGSCLIEYGEAFGPIPAGGQKDRLNQTNNGSLVVNSVEFAMSDPSKTAGVTQTYVSQETSSAPQYGGFSLRRKLPPGITGIIMLALMLLPLAAFAQGGDTSAAVPWWAQNYGWVIFGGFVVAGIISGLVWYFSTHQRSIRVKIEIHRILTEIIGCDNADTVRSVFPRILFGPRENLLDADFLIGCLKSARCRLGQGPVYKGSTTYNGELVGEWDDNAWVDDDKDKRDAIDAVIAALKTPNVKQKLAEARPRFALGQAREGAASSESNFHLPKVIAEFLEFLQENGLNDVVWFGDGVRNMVEGKEVQYLLVTFIVPFSDSDEHLKSNSQEWNKVLGQRLRARMDGFADALGTTLWNFQHAKASFQGLLIRYAGPYWDVQANEVGSWTYDSHLGVVFDANGRLHRLPSSETFSPFALLANGSLLSFTEEPLIARTELNEQLPIHRSGLPPTGLTTLLVLVMTLGFANVAFAQGGDTSAAHDILASIPALGWVGIGLGVAGIIVYGSSGRRITEVDRFINQTSLYLSSDSNDQVKSLIDRFGADPFIQLAQIFRGSGAQDIFNYSLPHIASQIKSIEDLFNLNILLQGLLMEIREQKEFCAHNADIAEGFFPYDSTRPIVDSDKNCLRRLEALAVDLESPHIREELREAQARFKEHKPPTNQLPTKLGGFASTRFLSILGGLVLASLAFPALRHLPLWGWGLAVVVVGAFVWARYTLELGVRLNNERQARQTEQKEIRGLAAKLRDALNTPALCTMSANLKADVFTVYDHIFRPSVAAQVGSMRAKMALAAAA